MRNCASVTLSALLLVVARPALAQMHHHHAAADTTAHAMHHHHATMADTASRAPHHHHATRVHGTSHAMPGMDTAGMDMAGMEMGMPMNGMYGPYPMTREASGTSWQPDAAEPQGIHVMRDPWMLMLHGMGDLVVDHQGGPRGDDKIYSDNMLMGMAQRSLGIGTLGLRIMVSAEPATIGKSGYPLLLQTGETADGRTPLIDRQHPHDMLMELAGAYCLARGDRSVFVYAGLPGEPALGPPAFMHRFSGLNIPEAPITHHWLDSTHITYGVLTAGAIVDQLKLEASAFRGREPDENRWDIESPRLDSHSFRISLNPSANWALQASYGRLESPEQLEPNVDQDRTTASAIYDGHWTGGHWETTFAWGRNRNRPGHSLDAFTAEAAAEIHTSHTVFLRAERVRKDELFVAPDAQVGRVFTVGELTAGYRLDLWRRSHLALGIGALGTLALIPADLRDAYGESPSSLSIFAHAGLR